MRPLSTWIGRMSAAALLLAGAVLSGAWANSPESSSGFNNLLRVDRVVVRKSERRLMLIHGEQVVRDYHVSLGLQPVGPKSAERDFRTPEGRYRLARRNPRSDYFMSMLVSYPNADDQKRARRSRVKPGGSIMIHGLPNDPRHPADYYTSQDWTDGCIAVSNSDMLEIWMLVSDNTPIEIQP